MTIAQLILELQAIEDQEKIVIVVCGDDDHNIIDTFDFELHCVDVDSGKYLEIFIYADYNDPYN